MTPAASLGTRAARGILWTGGAAALQLGSILVLYRLLPIAEMGHFEYALILMMFLALLANLGLSAALVQQQDVEAVHFDSALWLNLALGVGLCALVQLTAHLLAALLNADAPVEFAHALRVLALILPPASVSGIFRARLQRNLDFAAVAWAELASVAAFGVYVVPLVMLRPGWGVDIPLTGAVLRELGLLAGLWWGSRWMPRCRCRWPALRSMLPFALHFTGSRAVAYVNSNIASLYVFPLLGGTALGLYKLGERLTITPLVRLSTTVTNVALPTFSVLQTDDARLRRAYVRGVQSLVLLLGPLLGGMAVFAPEILAILGRPAALTVLRILAAATLLKAMGTMAGSAFMAKGRADWLWRWSVFCLLVLVPALMVGVRHGLDAVAVAVAGSSLLFLALSQLLVDRLLGLPARDFLAAVARPLGVTALVALACAAVRPWLPGPPAAALGGGVGVAMLATAAAVRLLAWDLVGQQLQTLRGR